MLTGATWYAGSHTALSWHEAGHHVVVIDNLAHGTGRTTTAAIPALIRNRKSVSGGRAAQLLDLKALASANRPSHSSPPNPPYSRVVRAESSVAPLGIRYNPNHARQGQVYETR